MENAAVLQRSFYDLYFKITGDPVKDDMAAIEAIRQLLIKHWF